MRNERYASSLKRTRFDFVRPCSCDTPCTVAFSTANIDSRGGVQMAEAYLGRTRMRNVLGSRFASSLIARVASASLIGDSLRASVRPQHGRSGYFSGVASATWTGR